MPASRSTEARRVSKGVSEVAGLRATMRRSGGCACSETKAQHTTRKTGWEGRTTTRGACCRSTGDAGSRTSAPVTTVFANSENLGAGRGILPITSRPSTTTTSSSYWSSRGVSASAGSSDTSDMSTSISPVCGGGEEVSKFQSGKPKSLLRRVAKSAFLDRTPDPTHPLTESGHCAVTTHVGTNGLAVTGCGWPVRTATASEESSGCVAAGI